MKQSTVYAKPFTPSTAYQLFMPIVDQLSSDGSNAILDRSGNSKNATINANTTYAGVLATANWSYCTSATTASSSGKGFSAANIAQYDLSANKSMILAFKFKTPSNAIPSASGIIMGSDNNGGKGLKIYLSTTSGRLAVNIYDGTTNGLFQSASGTSLCDTTEHNAVIMIGGTGKKGYMWIDNVLVANAISLSSVTGSTVGTLTNWSFGHSGNPATGGTFDSGGSPTQAGIFLRGIHYLIMSSFPSNYLNIAAWFNEPGNIYNALPIGLLP